MVFKIQTLNSQDANSRGNNPESIMQLHMYVHAQMYAFVHRQVCIHIYMNMYTCACMYACCKSLHIPKPCTRQAKTNPTLIPKP